VRHLARLEAHRVEAFRRETFLCPSDGARGIFGARQAFRRERAQALEQLERVSVREAFGDEGLDDRLGARRGLLRHDGSLAVLRRAHAAKEGREQHRRRPDGDRDHEVSADHRRRIRQRFRSSYDRGS
jgi:hypothetical protein